MSAIHQCRPVHANAIWNLMPTKMNCVVCGQGFSVRGIKTHLRKCLPKAGMTFEQYVNKYPDVLFHPFNAISYRFFQLLTFDMTRFGWQTPFIPYVNGDGQQKRKSVAPYHWDHLDGNETWGYQTYDSRTPPSWYYRKAYQGGPRFRIAESYSLNRGFIGLSDGKNAFTHFKIHLQGRGTLAVKPVQGNRFLCFDIDNEKFRRVRRLSERIEKLGMTPHLEFSGSKGYHIWVFLDRDYDQDLLRGLAKSMLDGYRLNVDRIYPLNKCLIKLPLGIHQKTGKFCGFVDVESEEIMPVEDQIQYFMDITPDRLDEKSCRRIESHPTKPRRKKKVQVEKIEPKRQVDTVYDKCTSENHYDKLIENGGKISNNGLGGRHLSLYLFAVYLRTKKLMTRPETEIMLTAWSEKVDSKYPIAEKLRDLRSTLDRVYSRNFTTLDTQGKKALSLPEKEAISKALSFYFSAYGAIRKIRACDVSKRMKTSLNVACFLTSVAKGNQGRVSIGHRAIARELGVSRRTVDTTMPLLVSDIRFDTLEEIVRHVKNGGPPKIKADIVDTRPIRLGCIFICTNRGSYPAFDSSVYEVRPEMVSQLGWDHPADGGL